MGYIQCTPHSWIPESIDRTLARHQEYIPKTTNPVDSLHLERHPVALMNTVPRRPQPRIRMAANETLFQSLSFGRVPWNSRTQTANERQPACLCQPRSTQKRLARGGGARYRGCDAVDHDFACLRIDNDIGAPSFAFLNLHTVRNRPTSQPRTLTK